MQANKTDAVRLVAVVFALSAVPLRMACATDPSSIVSVEIQPQPLEGALVELSKQGHLQLVIPTASLPTRISTGLHGSMTLGVALDLLLRNTGLTYKMIGDHTVAIVKSRTSDHPSDPPTSPGVPGEATATGRPNNERGQIVDHRSWKWRLATFLGICLSTAGQEPVCAQSAPAADASGSALEEIIVTARRREENLQTVPIAVSVVSQASLTQNNIGTLNQLQYLVPSMTVVPNGYSETVAINIRGQGAAYGGNQPGVIMYLNDVPLPAISTGSYGGPGLFFDLQNAQVLKGPQGTLFGRNSVGGNVVLESARPTKDFEGYLQGSYGNYKDHEFTGAVNVPLVSDVLLLRVAFETQMRDGFSHIAGEPGRSNGLDGDNRHTRSIRATLSFHPTDWLQNDLIGGYADYHQIGSPPRIVPSTTSNVAAAVYGADFTSLVQQQAALGSRSYIPINNDDESDGKLMSLSDITHLTLNDRLSVRNIIGYQSLTQRLQIDQDGTALPIFDYPVPPPPTTQAPVFSARRQFSEEAQLLGNLFDGRLDWIAGGFFLDDPGTDGPAVNGSGSVVLVGTPLPQSIVQLGEWSRALFAQGTYALTSQLKLTGGARYTWDTVRQITLGNLPTSVCAGPTLVDCGAESAVTNEAHSHAITWTGGLDYQLQPGKLLYLAAHRGYRGGGFNAPTEGISPPPFGPEFVTDGELGFKADWKVGDMAIRTNADVWCESYTQIQLSANIPEPITPLNPAGYIAYTINAGKGKLYGAELESEALFTDNFKVGVNFSYTKKNYTSFSPYVPEATLADLRASETLGAPHVKYGINANYRLPLPRNVGDVSLSANWNWQSASGDISVPLNYGMIPSFGLLNLAADWKGVYGSSLDVALFASNALDKLYINNAVPFWQPGFWGGGIYYGEPRMYGLRLQYRFGARAK